MSKLGSMGFFLTLFLFLASCCLAGQMIKGDWDYCSPTKPCGVGEGDCDTDKDCVAGLHCEKDVGPQYDYAKGIDVCLGTPMNNNQTSGSNSDDNTVWAGGGVKPGTNSGNPPSSPPINNSGACSNVFYAATHVKECYGVTQNTGTNTTPTGRTTGQGCGVKWNPGDFNYCRNCGPCDEGVGGCDPGLNHQCKGDLICSNAGVCEKP